MYLSVKVGERMTTSIVGDELLPVEHILPDTI